MKALILTLLLAVTCIDDVAAQQSRPETEWTGSAIPRYTMLRGRSPDGELTVVSSKGQKRVCLTMPDLRSISPGRSFTVSIELDGWKKNETWTSMTPTQLDDLGVAFRDAQIAGPLGSELITRILTARAPLRLRIFGAAGTSLVAELDFTKAARATAHVRALLSEATKATPQPSLRVR